MLRIFKKCHETLTTDIDTLVVRWNKKYGQFSDNYKEVAQFFTNKEEAQAFADSLRRANKLLGHTCSILTWVICEKVSNKGL